MFYHVLDFNQNRLSNRFNTFYSPPIKRAGKRAGQSFALLFFLALFSTAASQANAQEGSVVTGLYFEYFDTARTSNPCVTSGYHWDKNDLNGGAGGTTDSKFIYLCTKKEPISGSSETAITDVQVTQFKEKPDTNDICPSGFLRGDHPVDGALDLNKGAGSDSWYIYMCYKRGGDHPILDLDIVVQAACDENYTLINKNLNHGNPTVIKYNPFLCYQDLSNIPSSFDCGGEGESPCLISTKFYWENGEGGCDRGLNESGGECVDATRRQQVASDFQGSWTHWALLQQVNHIARDVKIGNFTMIGSHNAFNNRADGYVLLANQQYSITDQLRAGIRLIDLDIHAGNGGEKLVTGTLPELCHGSDNHSGCVIGDRLFDSALKEIRHWLLSAEGLDQTIVILLEDYIDEDDFEVTGSIRRYFDDQRIGVYDSILIGSDGNGLPSRRQMLAENKRVLIFAQKKAYAELALEKNPDESTGRPRLAAASGGRPVEELVDYFGRNYDDIAMATDPEATTLDPDNWCDPDDENPLHHIHGIPVRQFQAPGVLPQFPFSWHLITEVNGDRLPGAALPVRSNHLRELSRCAVDFVNIDNVLFAEEDIQGGHLPGRRLKGAIWSWEENDYGQSGDAAMMRGNNGRWVSTRSTSELPFACLDEDGETFRVSDSSGPFLSGWDICNQEFRGTFTTPVNGWMNQKIKEAAASQNVWINYSTIGSIDGSQFIINTVPEIQLTNDGSSVDESSQPVTFSYVIIDDSPETVDLADPDCGVAGTYVPSSLINNAGLGEFKCVFSAGGTASADSTSSLVTLRGTDPIGLVGTATLDVIVSNVDPVITSVTLSTSAIEEHGVLTVQGHFFDPGADSHQLRIDWGDGEAEIVQIGAGLRKFSVSNRYLDDDPMNTPSDVYNLSIELMDEKGADTQNRTVTIENAAPELKVDNVLDELGNRVGLDIPLVLAGTSISLAGSYTDVGTLDTHEITIDWGEGSTENVESLASTHLYASPGVFDIVVSVTDDDTGTVSEQRSVMVVSPERALAFVVEQLKSLPSSSKATSQTLKWLQGANNGKAKNGALDALHSGKDRVAAARVQRALIYLGDVDAGGSALNLQVLQGLLGLIVTTL